MQPFDLELLADGEIIEGDEDNNSLNGTSGDDHIFGWGGNDIIDGGPGADVMFGQAGDDIYYVDQVGDWVTEIANEGRDRVYSLVTFQLSAHVEELVLIGAAHIDGLGNNAANLIVGNIGNNWLKGFGGDDSLWGGLGNDILDGGTGADHLVGGVGNDVYYVDALADSVVERELEGIDRVYSLVSLTLPSHVEELVLIGAGDIDATGDDVRNLLVGNIANNVLYGLGGDDQLFGGLGNDVLDGGAGIDKLVGGAGDDVYYVDRFPEFTEYFSVDEVVEAANGGHDTVYSINSPFYGMTENVEDGVLIASSSSYLLDDFVDLAGNSLDNTLRIILPEEQDGGVYGGYLWGRDGKDTLYGSEGSNWLFGEQGDDTLYGGTGVNYFSGGFGDDLMIANGTRNIFEFFFGGKDRAVIGDVALANNSEIRTFTGGTYSLIDLSGIDASSVDAGNNAFTLVDAFTGVAGELLLEAGTLPDYDYIKGDIDGDGVADLSIVLFQSSVGADNIIL